MGLFICIVLFFVFGGFIGVSVIGMHFHPKGKNQKSTDEIEEFEEIKVTYENENDKMYDNLNVSKLWKLFKNVICKYIYNLNM